MKGVILAGGNGTRLRPLTEITNKHLLPVYNKPMIDYPINTLKELGCDKVLLISGGEHIGDFMKYLNDGSKFGIDLIYKIQAKPDGIAGALRLAKDFIHNEKFIVCLGDNIFLGNIKGIKIDQNNNADIIVKSCSDAQRFGVVEYNNKDNNHVPVRILEKPQFPPSNDVVTGLYAYPPDLFKFIETLQPSARGEYEITDINNIYLTQKRLKIHNFEGEWTDAGTFPSLFMACKNAIRYENKTKTI